MADDELSGGVERAAADPLESGSSTSEAPVAAPMKTADARRRFALPDTAVLFAVLGVLVVFFSITSQYFLNADNLINILQNTARIGIVACPATLLLISGQFDLSVGSASAFVAMVAAIAAATSGSPITPGLPLWVALAGLLDHAVLGQRLVEDFELPVLIEAMMMLRERGYLPASGPGASASSLGSGERNQRLRSST